MSSKGSTPINKMAPIGNMNNKLFYKFYESAFTILESPLLIIEYETDVCVLVNDEFCKKIDLDKNDIIGKKLSEIISYEKNRDAITNFTKSLEKKGFAEIRTSLHLPNKTLQLISLKGKLTTVNGAKYIVGIINDLSDLEIAKIKAEQAASNLENIFYKLPYPIFVQEIAEDGFPGRIIEANKIAHENLDYTREEMMNITINELDPSITPEEAAKIGEEFVKNKEAIIIRDFPKKDEGYINAKVTLLPIKWDKKPAILGFVDVKK